MHWSIQHHDIDLQPARIANIIRSQSHRNATERTRVILVRFLLLLSQNESPSLYKRPTDTMSDICKERNRKKERVTIEPQLVPESGQIWWPIIYCRSNITTSITRSSISRSTQKLSLLTRNALIPRHRRKELFILTAISKETPLLRRVGLWELVLAVYNSFPVLRGRDTTGTIPTIKRLVYPQSKQDKINRTLPLLILSMRTTSHSPGTCSVVFGR